ncbi:MAG: hypothetical protein OXF02_06155 [Simkaniaceae bacterium]|nr:hypothetical protein [Simkaniaceae bacterium]
MKCALSKLHTGFFRSTGYIEFEGLFSETQITLLKKISSERLAARSGFDLWRSSEKVKNLLFSIRPARIAGELVETSSLRIGFDQPFYGTNDPNTLIPGRTGSLAETSSLERVVCAMIVRLDPAPLNEGESPPGLALPQEPGNALFLSPGLPLIPCRPRNGLYILVVYTSKHTLYRLRRSDPYPYVYKHMGYRPGQQLSDTTHPLLLY